MINSGILNIYKPQEYTSHDCVNIVRRTLGIKRVGHTGTLDPMATGVLVVCVGRSTRIMEYLDADYKTYRCTMKLGITTSTQDIWGEVIEERPFDCLSESIVRHEVMNFEGYIDQIPPKYSAVKVNGRRLYQYAREDKPVEIKPRKVYIDKIEIQNCDLQSGELTFLMTCGKGTYVRAVCHDLGQRLKCGGTMCFLERIENGVFSIDSALSIEDVKTMTSEDLSKYLMPMDYPLEHLGKVVLCDTHVLKYLNGMKIPIEKTDIIKMPFSSDCMGEGNKYVPRENKGKDLRSLYCVYETQCNTGHRFLGTATIDEKSGCFKADKVFMKREL